MDCSCLDAVVRRCLKPPLLKRIVPHVTEERSCVRSCTIDIGCSVLATIHDEEFRYEHIFARCDITQRNKEHGSGNDAHYGLINRKAIANDRKNHHHRKHIPELGLFLRFSFAVSYTHLTLPTKRIV